MPTLSAARLVLAVAAAAVVVLVGAPPAGAHVEATVQPGAQAGAGPATVVFSAAAESPAAGIASIRTQLPAGVPPDSVSLASGPDGWALTPTADGYDVSGPALPPGTDAEFTIAIERLPTEATVLVFKTLVRYTDGSEDAWIEEPTADNPEPQNPAPAITVAPAASTAPLTSTSTSPPEPTTSSAAPTPATSAEVRTEDVGPPAWPFVLATLGVVAAVGGLAYRRYRSGPRN